MSSDAADLLALRAQPQDAMAGASSFFAHPSSTLDPNLFDVTKNMYQAVRQWLLASLYSVWSQRYHHPHNWCRVWLAGSGATFQWDAYLDAGMPGDLDVLIGIDFPLFYAFNTEFAGTPEADMANRLNDELKRDLWPRTDHQVIGTGVYQITWFVNPGATDIRDISPYAAYNVTGDRWTVRPPDLLPDWDPRRDLPAGWVTSFDTEGMAAAKILRDYHDRVQMIAETPSNSPVLRNHAVRLAHIVKQGADLFDDIHTGRHDAFRPGGGGYASYANARWQFGKQDGRVAALHLLKTLWAGAQSTASVTDPHRALVLAAMRGTAYS